VGICISFLIAACILPGFFLSISERSNLYLEKQISNGIDNNIDVLLDEKPSPG